MSDIRQTMSLCCWSALSMKNTYCGEFLITSSISHLVLKGTSNWQPVLAQQGDISARVLICQTFQHHISSIVMKNLRQNMSSGSLQITHITNRQMVPYRRPETQPFPCALDVVRVDK